MTVKKKALFENVGKILIYLRPASSTFISFSSPISFSNEPKVFFLFFFKLKGNFTVG